MKVVSNAVIKIVKFSELNIGDYILWSNWKRKVIDIDRLNFTIMVDDPNTERTTELKIFANYYVIKSCVETEIYMDE